MWQRGLEERIEVVRKKMVDTAIHLGFGHPKVYRLSKELDQLHNEWQQKRKKIYRIRSETPIVKEKSILPYQTVV